VSWEAVWVCWPDFCLPLNRAAAIAALVTAHRRLTEERVEIACGAGRGRTGTALACLAALDGLGWAEAVAYVRSSYHPHAVETPWQRRFVKRFATWCGAR
jgi:protein-tyrosine phosphatase